MATRRWLIAIAVLAAGFLAAQVSPDSLSSAEFMFTSPIASPTPVVAPFLDPAPTPVLSAEAQIALQYVSNGYSIPVEYLRAGRAATIQYQTTGKTLWQATISDSEGNTKEIVTVDKSTGQVVDGEAMREAEVQSRVEKYDKLEPALHERIQTMSPDETVKVSIWLASVDIERIQAEVAARYPTANLIDRRPSKETDPKLYEQISVEMRAAEQRVIQEREAPVLAWLEEKGYKVTYASRYAPLLFAELSQKGIDDLSQRNDVAAIYLSKTYEPTLSSAIQTNRTTAVWSAGITGSGVQVAVVEAEGIDFSHPDLADGVYANPNNPNLGVGHATQVAGVIASTHSTDRGIAYGVSPLFSANAGSFAVADIIEATEDALVANARILNLSFGCPGCNQIDETARYYDHVVSTNFPTVVAATQNYTFWPVGSPALAYNVIGTGGIDDKDSSNWSDDTMWDDGFFSGYEGSSYQNPADGREKPEVVAVAKSVRTTSINSGFATVDGNSFSTPQVSGLAALLMQRNGTLTYWPEAVKAIVMASAAHNVDGARLLTSGDDKDGVGAIDAALADSVVKNGWWIGDSIGYGVNEKMHTFGVVAGEKVRVALSWLSHTDDNHPPSTDTLRTNLNLRIEEPNGAYVTQSTSTVDSFEVVEFTATKSGLYRIKVQRASSNTDLESFGIAWSKQATYLPDVRGSNSGWTSSLVVRNDGAEPRPVRVTYFLENGNFAAGQDYPGQLAPNATWTTSPPSWLLQGSAIVDGSEDLSVVVENIYSVADYHLAAAYPGETAPATTVYVPFFLKKWPTLNSNWRQTSELLIQNSGSQSASVTVTIYDSWDSDSGFASLSYTIPAGGRQSVPATHFSQNWDYGGFLAAARVSTTSGQPLAVIVNTLTGIADGNGVITTPYLAGSYRGESRPANFLYASTTGREYYGYDSSLQVQNASGSNTTFRLKFYSLNSGTPSLTLDTTVGPYRSANFWRPTGMSAGFFGSATVEVLTGGPLAVMAQYDRFDTASNRYGVTQYEGVSALNSSLGMAHIQKSNPWTYTGIQAQNMNNSAANIQLHYFNTDGASHTPAGSVTKSNVPANAAVSFWSTAGTPPRNPQRPQWLRCRQFSQSGLAGQLRSSGRHRLDKQRWYDGLRRRQMITTRRGPTL